MFARLHGALGNYLRLNLYPNTIPSNVSIFLSDHAPMLLSLSMSTPHNTYCRFKFEAKWSLDNELFDLLNDVWSNYIKSSCAYQIKLNYLKVQLEM